MHVPAPLSMETAVFVNVAEYPVSQSRPMLIRLLVN
jgi:hypothetical protein